MVVELSLSPFSYLEKSISPNIYSGFSFNFVTLSVSTFLDLNWLNFLNKNQCWTNTVFTFPATASSLIELFFFCFKFLEQCCFIQLFFWLNLIKRFMNFVLKKKHLQLGMSEQID